MSLDYDTMDWLVTTDDATYGPLSKKEASLLRAALRERGETAEAWAAQAPDPRVIKPPPNVGASA